jgi:hypothetical protein
MNKSPLNILFIYIINFTFFLISFKDTRYLMWPAMNMFIDVIETQLYWMVPGSHPGQDGKNSA